MGLGLLLSAVSGGANAVNQDLTEQQKVRAQMDIDAAREAADLQRQQAMSQFNQNLANQQRLQQTTDVNAGAQSLADARAGLLNSGVQDQSSAIQQAYDTAAQAGDPNVDSSTGTTAAQQFLAANPVTPASITPMDILNARVNQGYDTPMPLLSLEAQGAANSIAQRRQDLAEQVAQHNITHQDDLLAEQIREANMPDSTGRSADKTPEEIKLANWYAANSKNPDLMAAWNITHNAKSKTIQDVAASLMSKNPDLTPQQAVSQAQSIYNMSNGVTPTTPVLKYDPSTGTFK